MDASKDLGKCMPRRYESDFGDARNLRETLDFSQLSQAQSGAEQCAYPNTSIPEGSSERNPLGQPLSIRQVAALLGCSAWTVRQRYLPQGLPHLRACSGGRIIFFREQVIAWILKRQQAKGGRK